MLCGWYSTGGKVLATSARSSRSSPATRPAARPWISTLPTAVASTGPANTRRPVRFAVNWQSSVFWLPPPTTCTVLIFPPLSRSASSIARRVRLCEALHDAAGKHRRRIGRSCACIGAQCGNPLGHVAGWQQAGMIRVEDRHRGTDRGRLIEQLRQLDG